MPLPVPLAVTPSQLALELAVHGHVDALILSATPLDSPAAVELALELPRDAVQPDAWETVNVEPPVTMEPERAGPVLAATVKLTVPLPVPDAVMPVMNASGEAAVQVQLGELIVIVKDELRPVAVAESELGDRLAVQPPACVTLKVLPAMVITPEREVPALAE